MSRLTKKELRTPDELWQVSASAFEWTKTRWLPLSLGLGAALLLLFVWLFVAELQKQKEAEAQHIFGRVLSLYEQWQFADEEAQKAQFWADYEAALNELELSFPGSQARDWAGMMQAQAAFLRGDWAEAESLWRETQNSLPSRARDFARFPLAVSLENQEKWEEAAEIYKSISSREDSAYRSWALLGLGRSQQELGQKEEALKTFSTFLEEFPNSGEASRVRAWIAMVEGS